jgi:carotenoid 1,2-hydratase
VSEDRAAGVTLIAFVGSVFSPYYRAARRHGPADPLDYCALNLAVHSPAGSAWVFTEWPRPRVTRTPDRFALGPSVLEWRGDELCVHLDERVVPGHARVQGGIRLRPHHLFGHRFILDAAGRHRWWAIAPAATVEVELERPALRFCGTGYHDANEGDEPLERAFHTWTWARLSDARGTTVLYDADRQSGGPMTLAQRFDADGGTRAVTPPPPVKLPRTPFFFFPRTTRSLPDRGARVLATTLDSPFYARSVIEAHLDEQARIGVHESLSLDRFATPWMQWMLRYRVRRLLP